MYVYIYIYIFTYLFINYHSINDSCQYLLLPDIISSKTKTFSTKSHHKKPTKRSFILINVL